MADPSLRLDLRDKPPARWLEQDRENHNVPNLREARVESVAFTHNE
jgi:hypothetical protein